MTSKRVVNVISHSFRKAKQPLDKIYKSDFSRKEIFEVENLNQKNKRIQQPYSSYYSYNRFQQTRDYHLLKESKEQVKVTSCTYHQKTQKRKEIARAIHIAAENLQSTGVSPEPLFDTAKMEKGKCHKQKQRESGCPEEEPIAHGKTVVMHCPHVIQCEQPCCTVHLHSQTTECCKDPTPIKLRGTKCTQNPHDHIDCECQTHK